MEGVLITGSVGLASSASLAAWRYLPARYRLAVAVASPVAVAYGVEAYFRHRFDSKLEEDIHNKISWVDKTIQSDSEFLSAGRQSREVHSQRLSTIRAASTKFSDQDVDANGFLDRNEIYVSAKTETNEIKFNTFLYNNYADLSLISSNVSEKNVSRGVSEKALMVLTNDLARQVHFFDQQQRSSIARQEAMLNGLAWGTGLGIGAGGSLAWLSKHHVPPKYRSLCIAGSIAAGLATTAGVPIHDYLKLSRENEKFIQSQKDAISRILSRI
jgi:hypothetical protein